MRTLPIVLPALLALCSTLGFSADQDQSPEAPWELLAPLAVEQLDNGMTFLIYPNRRAPIFSGVVTYNVGGKDEKPGQTGIAHMFEHMAFKGTQSIGTTNYGAEKLSLEAVEAAAYAFDAERNRLVREGLSGQELEERLNAVREAFEKAKADAAQFVVKDEFDEIYNREGGSQMNAWTSSDATTYFISLPANRLELWARMESGRLLQPVMREFYSERDVVMEERRMRHDNNPVGRLWEQTMAAAYVAHPYGYPVIGWEDDIRNLKATEAREFYRAHYTPDRAVGVLVGDLDVEKTRALLRETFGRIPAREPGRYDLRIVPEPPQEGERRIKVRLPATPTLLMGWHKPDLPDAADLHSEVLMQVLTGGRSSRWFERFIKRERIASEVEAFTGPGDAEPNLFTIYAGPQGETTLEKLEQALRDAVRELQEQPVGEEELARAKKVLRANVVRALESNLGLAQRLADYTRLSGDPYYLERRLRQLERVTVEDLQRFAQAWLTETNLTVGWLEPPPAEKPI